MIKTVEPYTPIQYVMGKSDFFGLSFLVNENVLIPRPETEVLVKEVIDTVMGDERMARDARVLDLCTGSGNIAISLTKALTHCKIIASDISEAALNVARQNAVRHGVSDKISFLKSDLFGAIDGLFDIIVSNPPYIARREFASLQKEVLKEPSIALDGGEDGLDFYRRIMATAHLYLRRSGAMAVEIGYGQGRSIAGIIGRTGALRVEKTIRDHNGIERVLLVRWIN